MKGPKELIGNRMQNDPRIEEAKKNLIKVVQEYQSEIVSIRKPNPQYKEEFHQILEDFAKIRGGKLFYPYLGSGIGKGALVELLDGSIKYDFITGIGVHCFGHSHPDVIEAQVGAAITDTVMEGHLQQNSDAMELSELLLEQSGMDHCFLTSTGVMANENALKICFQQKHPASRILAFEKCFMGRTNALSQITDKPAYRIGLPITYQIDYVPFYDPEDPKGSTLRTMETLRAHLNRYPKQHAAMCFELIQGEAGFRDGTEDFFKEIMNFLQENGILVVVDEVQTFGRTPELFAYHYFNLHELVDIVNIGKLSQACATLYKTRHLPKPGLLSQTFTTSTSAIRASKVIIEKMIEKGHFGKGGKNDTIHMRFSSGLAKISEKYPNYLQGPFGIGGMIAFTPYNGTMEQALHFVKELFEEGVISFVAGTDPTRCRFLVPLLAITEEDIDQVLQIVETTLVKCKELLHENHSPDRS